MLAVSSTLSQLHGSRDLKPAPLLSEPPAVFILMCPLPKTQKVRGSGCSRYCDRLSNGSGTIVQGQVIHGILEGVEVIFLVAFIVRFIISFLRLAIIFFLVFVVFKVELQRRVSPSFG
jgi:hypothetical protein